MGLLAAGLLAAAALLAPLGEALAQSGGQSGSQGAGYSRPAAEPALLSFGGGWYDPVAQDDQAADFRVEYRHDRGFLWFKPWIGGEVTTDGALYGAGGLYVDIPLGQRFLLTGSLGAGAYSDGDGKDLGHTVIFRSQIELGYRLENDHRISLAFSHLSNADLGNRNPGTEVVTLYYHVPLGQLLRR